MLGDVPLTFLCTSLGKPQLSLEEFHIGDDIYEMPRTTLVAYRGLGVRTIKCF